MEKKDHIPTLGAGFVRSFQIHPFISSGKLY